MKKFEEVRKELESKVNNVYTYQELNDVIYYAFEGYEYEGDSGVVSSTKPGHYPSMDVGVDRKMAPTMNLEIVRLRGNAFKIVNVK